MGSVMIGRTISHYEILEQVGDGGMGSVYKALDTKLQVHRALKFIHPHLVADEAFKLRFIQEAQAASSLDHANICAIHEVDETEAGRPFICMTYYEGGTLSRRLEEAPLPAVEVFRIGFSIASGLNCAHQNGIVHRDIKPANILINEDNQIKILDFGLAKLAGAVALTKTGVTLGTVRYMSPEQATGQETDHRSDIWSLGLLMYEMATGEYPFQGDFDPAVIYSILNTDPKPAHELNADIPETHSLVIARCLAKDPDKRYQSISELIHDMGAAARAEGWESTFGEMMLSVSNGGFGAIPARRRTWRRGLLTAVAVVVAAVAVIWWTSRPPPLYTTDLRVAVMPLENRAHPDQDRVTDGMTDVIAQFLQEASKFHDSMWVVPNVMVRYAELAEDEQARRSFGVNHIVTGSLQRFQGGVALMLVLRHAESLDQIRTVLIPYDTATSAFSDSLPGALLKLIDLGRGNMVEIPRFLPDTGRALQLYLHGLGSLQTKNYAEAMGKLERATSADSMFGMGWLALGTAQGQSFLKSGNEELFSKALESLNRSAGLEPLMWQPLFRAGEYHRLVRNTDQALADYQAARALDPGNSRVCGRLARVLQATDQVADAETVLKSVTERSPDYYDAHLMLGRFYYREDEEEACLQSLNQALALAPDEVRSLNMKGAIFVARGDYARAREYFERSFALVPTCDTSSNIGFSLYHEKQYQDSASFYELSLEYCDRDNPQVWANWARSLYWADGGRPASIEKFRTAIALTWEEWERSPGDPLVIGNLIEYHAMIGDAPTTRSLIATADSLGSDHAELLYQIGDAYELLGDRRIALRYLMDAVRHGVPVERIENTPELAELAASPLFARMVAAESGSDDTQADSVP